MWPSVAGWSGAWHVPVIAPTSNLDVVAGTQRSADHCAKQAVASPHLTSDNQEGELIPQTSYQLIALFTLALPGIVFGSTLQRLRGPTPEDKDASTRILRAIAVGAGFDVVYFLAFGPQIVEAVRQPDDPGEMSALASHPREAALAVLLLAGVIPALTAYLIHLQAAWRDTPEGLTTTKRLRKAASNTYRTTPTAWDHIARARGGCFVRVRLADGSYVGGWADEETYVSGYPEPRDIFVRWQWDLDESGRFQHEIEGTLGIYVPLADSTHVEWLLPPPDDTDADTERYSDDKLPSRVEDGNG